MSLYIKSSKSKHRNANQSGNQSNIISSHGQRVKKVAVAQATHDILRAMLGLVFQKHADTFFPPNTSDVLVLNNFSSHGDLKQVQSSINFNTSTFCEALFETLKGLSRVVHYISLDNNDITTLHHVVKALQHHGLSQDLRGVSCQHNNLTSLDDVIAVLQGSSKDESDASPFPNLIELQLLGNPLCGDPASPRVMEEYRMAIRVGLPDLLGLDGEAIVRPPLRLPWPAVASSAAAYPVALPTPQWWTPLLEQRIQNAVSAYSNINNKAAVLLMQRLSTTPSPLENILLRFINSIVAMMAWDDHNSNPAAVSTFDAFSSKSPASSVCSSTALPFPFLTFDHRSVSTVAKTPGLDAVVRKYYSPDAMYSFAADMLPNVDSTLGNHGQQSAASANNTSCNSSHLKRRKNRAGRVGRGIADISVQKQQSSTSGATPTCTGVVRMPPGPLPTSLSNRTGIVSDITQLRLAQTDRNQNSIGAVVTQGESSRHFKKNILGAGGNTLEHRSVGISATELNRVHINFQQQAEGAAGNTWARGTADVIAAMKSTLYPCQPAPALSPTSDDLSNNFDEGAQRGCREIKNDMVFLTSQYIHQDRSRVQILPTMPSMDNTLTAIVTCHGTISWLHRDLRELHTVYVRQKINDLLSNGCEARTFSTPEDIDNGDAARQAHAVAARLLLKQRTCFADDFADADGEASAFEHTVRMIHVTSPYVITRNFDRTFTLQLQEVTGGVEPQQQQHLFFPISFRVTNDMMHIRSYPGSSSDTSSPSQTQHGARFVDRLLYHSKILFHPRNPSRMTIFLHAAGNKYFFRAPTAVEPTVADAEPQTSFIHVVPVSNSSTTRIRVDIPLILHSVFLLHSLLAVVGETARVPHAHYTNAFYLLVCRGFIDYHKEEGLSGPSVPDYQDAHLLILCRMFQEQLCTPVLAASASHQQLLSTEGALPSIFSDLNLDTICSDLAVFSAEELNALLLVIREGVPETSDNAVAVMRMAMIVNMVKLSITYQVPTDLGGGGESKIGLGVPFLLCCLVQLARVVAKFSVSHSMNVAQCWALLCMNCLNLEAVAQHLRTHTSSPQSAA